MTDANQPDDPADDPSAEHAPAAVHRRLSDAGVRLNEAQTHLSAVRTQATRDDLTTAVARAETRALVKSLEDARSQIDAALALAEDLAPDDTPETGADSDRTGTNEGESGRPSDEGAGTDRSGMLWNTVTVDVADDPQL